MNTKTLRNVAAVTASLAAVILVLDHQFDLGSVHDLVDFASGILIGISGTLMVLSKQRDESDEA